MAGLRVGGAESGAMTIHDEPNIGVLVDQGEDGSDDLMVAVQLANDNSWRSDDIEMPDATNPIPQVDGSLSSAEVDVPLAPHALQASTGIMLPGEEHSPEYSPLSDFSMASDDELTESEQERATTPQSEHDIDNLDKYAFNFNCGAYNHRVPQRFATGITLNVARVNYHTILAQYRQNLDAAGKTEVVPPLIPLHNESTLSSLGTECVWVGMLPSQAIGPSNSCAQPSADVDTNGKVNLDETPKKSFARKKGVVGSIKSLSEQDLMIAPFDANALRVVAKKSNEAIKHLYLYALVDPDSSSKLCQGYKVAMGDVYFFREFRDDSAMSFKLRRSATMELIKTMIFPALASPIASNFSGQVQDHTDTAMDLSTFQVDASETENEVDFVRRGRSSSPSPMPRDNVIPGNQVTPTKSARKAKKPVDSITLAMMKCISKAGGPRSSCSENEADGSEDLTGSIDDTNATLNQSVVIYEKDGIYDAMDTDDGVDNKTPVVTADGKINLDQQGRANHPIATGDSDRESYRNGLIEKFSHHQSGKAVSFQDSGGQLLDKRSEPLQPGVATSSIEESVYGHVNSTALKNKGRQEKIVKIAEKVKKVVNRLAADEDLAGLDQALVVLQSLEKGIRPPETSVLGLCLNVPPEECAGSRIDIGKLLVRPTCKLFLVRHIIGKSYKVPRLTSFLF